MVLKNFSLNYNFHLVPPQKNLTSSEDCQSLAGQEYKSFVGEFQVSHLKISIEELKKGELRQDLNFLQ